MKKLLFVFGTRPEAIKMAPLIKECQKYPDKFDVKVLVTGQHREMLDQILEFFKIVPDYDLNLMTPNQTLFSITREALQGMENIFDEVAPDLIIVQGDTTSVFAGALSGFYKKLPVAHLEAGLRSGDKYYPFPEEMNRILTSHIANYHWAPTERAKQNLLREGVDPKAIHVVQNTVIDALLLALKLIEKEGNKKYFKFFEKIDFNKKIILVTAHRRESFGRPFENICEAVYELAQMYPDIEFVYPVHPNPNVRESVYKILDGIANVHLLEPLDYPYMVWLMNKSYIILTDSGGIQEEAPSLGKPVLILRDVTERQEGVEAGTAKLTGTNKQLIVLNTRELLTDQGEYNRMVQSKNPYGDGKASERIVKLLNQ